MLVDLNELHRLNVDFIDPVQMDASNARGSHSSVERPLEMHSSTVRFQRHIPPSLAVSKLRRCRSCHKSDATPQEIDLFALHTRRRNFLDRISLCRFTRTHCRRPIVRYAYLELRERLNRTDDSRKSSRIPRGKIFAAPLPPDGHERARLRPRGGRSEPRHGSKESLANSASLCMSLRARVSA